MALPAHAPLRKSFQSVRARLLEGSSGAGNGGGQLLRASAALRDTQRACTRSIRPGRPELPELEVGTTALEACVSIFRVARQVLTLKT